MTQCCSISAEKCPWRRVQFVFLGTDWQGSIFVAPESVGNMFLMLKWSEVCLMLKCICCLHSDKAETLLSFRLKIAAFVGWIFNIENDITGMKYMVIKRWWSRFRFALMQMMKLLLQFGDVTTCQDNWNTEITAAATILDKEETNDQSTRSHLLPSFAFQIGVHLHSCSCFVSHY